MKLRLKDSFGMVPLKPGTRAAKPGTQAPSPASVRLDADERGEHSTSQIPIAVTPEEPALRAGAPAFPEIPDRVTPEDPGQAIHYFFRDS